MSDVETKFKRLFTCAAKVSDEINADVLVYAGDISSIHARELFQLVQLYKERPNVLLILCTYGGDPHAAYRIARHLQRAYANGKFIVFVPSLCKSAGTLLSLGADQIVMSEVAEFGPLDVQLLNSDVEDRTSGLVSSQALLTLRAESCSTFEALYLHIRQRTRLSSETAANVAGEIVGSLLRPIYQKLDPLKLGENDRSMTIATEYGMRLTKDRELLKTDAIAKLVSEYPSHGFVIDRDEANLLFESIRSPTETETELSELLEVVFNSRLYDESRSAFVHYLKIIPDLDIDPEEEDGEQVEQVEESEPPKAGEKDVGDE